MHKAKSNKSTLEDVWESYIAPYRIAEMLIEILIFTMV